MSRDPIGEEEPGHLYGFLGNESIASFDYLGLLVFSTPQDFDENDCREWMREDQRLIKRILKEIKDEIEADDPTGRTWCMVMPELSGEPRYSTSVVGEGLQMCSAWRTTESVGKTPAGKSIYRYHVTEGFSRGGIVKSCTYDYVYAFVCEGCVSLQFADVLKRGIRYERQAENIYRKYICETHDWRTIPCARAPYTMVTILPEGHRPPGTVR